jgi:DNA polymerase-1
VHVPLEHADAAAAMVDEALQEAAARWAPDRSVRFLADTSIVRSWADAK